MIRVYICLSILITFVFLCFNSKNIINLINKHSHKSYILLVYIGILVLDFISLFFCRFFNIHYSIIQAFFWVLILAVSYAAGFEKKRFLIYVGIFLSFIFSGKLLDLLDCYIDFHSKMESFARMFFTKFSFMLDKSVIALMYIVFFMIIIYMLIANIIIGVRYNEGKKKVDVMSHQIDVYRSDIKRSEEQAYKIKLFRHDIKNYLICLSEYAKTNNTDKVNEYIRMILKDEQYIADGKTLSESNEIFDAIINYKNNIAKKDNIEMVVRMNIPKELEIQDLDICNIMGNALDNAIESVRKLPVEERKICVKGNFKHNNLYISISNKYIDSLRRDSKGYICTSKQDKSNHGFGLRSIEETVQKYNGNININTNNNIFELAILLYLPD